LRNVIKTIVRLSVVLGLFGTVVLLAYGEIGGAVIGMTAWLSGLWYLWQERGDDRNSETVE